MAAVIFIILIGILILCILASCIKIVPQAYAVVLERLGAYRTTWDTGIHFKVPFIERVARKVNMKEYHHQASGTLRRDHLPCKSHRFSAFLYEGQHPVRQDSQSSPSGPMAGSRAALKRDRSPQNL